MLFIEQVNWLKKQNIKVKKYTLMVNDFQKNIKKQKFGNIRKYLIN